MEVQNYNPLYSFKLEQNMKTNTDVTTNIRRGKKPNHNIYEKLFPEWEKNLWGPCKKHYLAKAKS